MDEIPEYQHKPEKKKNYEERIKSGEQKHWQNKPRQRLRHTSQKRAPELREYARESVAFLRDKTCALCGTADNLSLHHMAGRGKLLNEQKYWIPLCLIGSEAWIRDKYPDTNHSHSGGCHGWVEANKTLAKELGFIIKPKQNDLT